MDISVIIPTYNRSRLVCRAVESVLNQTCLPIEIIVVNDGSTDKTQETLKKYSGKIIVLTQPNRGISSARNLGIDQSKGDWLAFLDSDDEWYPSKLEKQAGFHSDNPKLMISQTDEIWIRNGVRINQMKKHKKVEGWIFAQCLPLCLISPSAVIIHKSVFTDVGDFDEELPVCEDYDLWLRIALKYEIGLLSEKLVVKYGGHKDQLSAKYWGMDRFRIYAMEKHIHTALSDRLRKALLQELVKRCRIISEGAEKRANVETHKLYQDKMTAYEKLLESEYEGDIVDVRK